MHVQFNLVNKPAVHVHVCLLLDAVSIPFFRMRRSTHTDINVQYVFFYAVHYPSKLLVCMLSNVAGNELNTAYMYITFSASCFKKFAISLKLI